MSVIVRNVDDSDRSSWDDYVAAHSNHSFYHLYAWRHFFESYFRKQTFYLVAEEGNVIVGIAPLVRQKSILFGDYMVSLPFFNYGGVLANTVEVEAAIARRIADIAADTGVSHVELRGLAPTADLPSKSNKISMRLSLPASADELSKKLGSKLRSQIKRPQRENPVLRRGGLELLDSFYAVFSRNMRDLGTPVYAKRMFEEILRRFPEAADIVVLEIGGDTAAAGFLVHHDGVSEVPWASSDRRFNRVSINMLLYWEMLRRSIERGSSIFDFGRSSVDSGTYRFKRQWGAEPVQLHWSYILRDGGELPELNPENEKFSLAIRAWQKLPLFAANRIGPLLARNLP